MKDSVDIYGFKKLLENFVLGLNVAIKVNCLPFEKREMTKGERLSLKSSRRYLRKMAENFDEEFIEIRPNKKRRLNDIGEYFLNDLLKLMGMPHSDFKALYKE